MIGPARLFGQWLGVALLIYLPIVAVALIGRGSGLAVGGRAEDLFILASNPFMGLVVGVMATALVQSSSTVTSIIVGLVAGGMPVVIAVPIVMGANVGTTITNTLVSLGHVADEDGFRRAFAAATVHDFFNLLSIVIFLPLELTLHLLERAALILGTFLLGDGSYQQDSLNFVSAATEPLVNFIAWSVRVVPRPYDGISHDCVRSGTDSGDHYSNQSRAPTTDGREGRKGGARQFETRAYGRHSGWHRSNGRGPVVVDYHQPDRATGWSRLVRLGEGVPLHAGRQYRHLRHGVAGGGGHHGSAGAPRVADRPGAIAVQRVGSDCRLWRAVAASGAGGGRRAVLGGGQSPEGDGAVLRARRFFGIPGILLAGSALF